MNNYDMSEMRKQLILKLSANLKKTSRFYKEDYEAICVAVNRKTRKELIEAFGRTEAIAKVSAAEIKRNCQV